MNHYRISNKAENDPHPTDSTPTDVPPPDASALPPEEKKKEKKIRQKAKRDARLEAIKRM